MRKLIAALVLGVMACSSANAWKTIRWVDENGTLRFRTEREDWENRGGYYRASSEPTRAPSKKKNISIMRNGNTTIIEDTDTHEYTICSQNPYDKSISCH